MPPPSPRARLAEFFVRVDAFFARGSAVHGSRMVCGPGCDDCCRRRFSVTSLEAAAISDALAALPAEKRAELSARAKEPGSDVCPALDPDGRCAVYEARPLICRTHGLPIRFPAPAGTRLLPMLHACPKNFVGEDLAALDPTTVLDQGTMSTVLGALDAAFADEQGRERGERIEIAGLLAGADTRRSQG